MTSAEILRANIERRIAELARPLAALCTEAGVAPKRYYPLTSGEPKSVRLVTLDEIARVIHAEPWQLITEGAEFTEPGDGRIDSTAVFMEEADEAAMDRSMRWDIAHGRRTSHTLRTLDKVAARMGVEPAALITPA